MVKLQILYYLSKLILKDKYQRVPQFIYNLLQVNNLSFYTTDIEFLKLLKNLDK